MNKKSHCLVDLGGWLIICALTAAFLAGCQSNPFSYRGRFVPPENRISLVKGGERSGTWTTRDLSAHYKYTLDNDSLRIWGEVLLSDAITYNYNTLVYFHMDGIFVDGDGRVLQMTGLMTSGYDYTEYPLHFSTVVKLPPNTRYIAFSYRGEGHSGGDDAGGDSKGYFWEYPIL